MELRAAFDIGSGSTKCQVCEYDTASSTVGRTLYVRECPVNFGGDFLASGAACSLSEAIQTQGLLLLREIKQEVLSLGGGGRCLFSGIATEVFRKAKANGLEYLEKVRSTLDIPIVLLSQAEEAQVGFASVVQASGCNGQSDPIVWDSGGASFQISNASSNTYVGALGTSVSVALFLQQVRGFESFTSENQFTINPVTRAEADAYLALIDGKLDPNIPDWLRDKHEVFAASGINSLFNLCCSILSIKRGEDINSVSSFTLAEAEEALVAVLEKSDDYLAKFAVHENCEHPSKTIPKIALLVAVMRKTGIQSVKAYACIGSCLGMITNDRFWTTTPASGVTVTCSVLGGGEQEQQLVEYVMSNSRLTVRLSSYGATLTSLLAPDRQGNAEEMTLCYPIQDVIAKKEGTGMYFGCIAGRVANRIKEGKFTLEGQEYTLAVNNGVNALHGGIVGFDKKYWDSRILPTTTAQSGVEFTYVSPDGEEGYPGTLTVKVTYRLFSNDSLEITYFATASDKATPINLTNHTYWNLSGNGKRSVLEQSLALSCSKYLPVTETQIPTGELADVRGTPFDFLDSSGKLLSDAIPFIDGGGRPGLDHCFVVDKQEEEADKVAKEGVSDRGGGGKRRVHVATMTDSVSGRRLVLHATQPGVQVYSANWLDLDKDEASAQWPFVQHNALCLETQHFPDAINQSHFPSCVLSPCGEPYSHSSLYTFSVIDN